MNFMSCQRKIVAEMHIPARLSLALTMPKQRARQVRVINQHAAALVGHALLSSPSAKAWLLINFKFNSAINMENKLAQLIKAADR
jgi:hypothetical protein